MNHQDHELAEHHPWLRRLARRLARSTTRADDLVQDTCVTALRNAPPDAQMRPWLHAVMRKLAWGQVRSERRRMVREEGFSLTAPTVTMPDALVDHGVDRERLTAALASLPEPFHSTIVQRFLHGRSCAEIARSENIPAGTVRWRQARGLELLRVELGTPRRRFVLWALPFLGASERLVARCWRTLVAKLSSSKAAWLWLACAAVLYAVLGSTRLPPPWLADDRASSGRDGAGLEGASPDLTEGFAGESGGALGPLAAGWPGASATTLDGQLASVGPGGARPAGHELARASFDDPRGLDHADCPWDPVFGRRCAEPSATPAIEERCASVRRKILTSEAVMAGTPAARSVLNAAMQANRALARRLGCAWERAEGRGSSSAGGRGTRTPGDGGPAGDGKPPDEGGPVMEEPPACQTLDYGEGTCVLCPGQPPMCAPAECQSRMVADGVVCTTCSSAYGEIYNECPRIPPAACHSEIAASGLVCSTCDDQPGPPECLPAQCDVVNGACLTCVDPKGRVGVDCNAEYGTYGGASISANTTTAEMGSCSFSWGVPGVSGMTCHYAGQQSCVAEEYDDWHCLQCMFPDGSGTGACMSASEPLPDPLGNRPHGLPAPGHCVTDVSADGTVTCATCTRADLSATTSCRYAGVTTCDDSLAESDTNCMAMCQRDDGSHVPICFSPPGTPPGTQAVR